MSTPKYPKVKVKLTETDGNAFAILGLVCKALKEAGVSSEERKVFFDEAMAGNYDHLLGTCMKWVDVC